MTTYTPPAESVLAEDARIAREALAILEEAGQ